MYFKLKKFNHLKYIQKLIKNQPMHFPNKALSKLYVWKKRPSS